MILSEKKVRERLRVQSWSQLTFRQFLGYMELTSRISGELHRQILQEAPHYGNLLQEAGSFLRIIVEGKKKPFLISSKFWIIACRT